jgi:hypothetical protein
MNYYDALIEVAEDSPATVSQVPPARAGRQTKAVVEYELLAKQPYTYTEEDIAFEVYAILHDIPKTDRPAERKKFLSKGHPHLRVSPLAKRYGWGLHNNTEGKIALIAVESQEYKQLLKDPHRQGQSVPIRARLRDVTASLSFRNSARGHSVKLAQPRATFPDVLQKLWRWLTTYDGAGSGFPLPSTLLLTGAAAVVLGVVALAKAAIGAGLLGIAIGVVCITWAEWWHRARRHG